MNIRDAGPELKSGLPIKILQYGEGNFLRAFVDYMVDIANEQGCFVGGVAVVKPIPIGSLDAFRAQDNRYTVCLRGRSGGETVDSCRVITCIQKALDSYADYDEYMALAELSALEFVVSNTTEAGISFDPDCRLTDTPPAGYPGKLTQFLYRRYCHFSGAESAGLVILPVELIEDNGKKLKNCVEQYISLWNLESGFKAWIDSACVFCSTLVDRIVTGYPKQDAPALLDALGYEDALLDVAEPFGLWVIESEQDISGRIPLHKAGQPVVFTADQRPYRERKVRILNGAHTATVLAGYLAGLETVGGCMADSLIRPFMERAVMDEIVPFVPMPREQAETFANATFERFENPYIRHELLSISLNSVSKWKTRVLPSLKDYYAGNRVLPPCLTFSFAALLAFYTASRHGGDVLIGSRSGVDYEIRDNQEVLEFFMKANGGDTGEYVRAVAANEQLWGEDLTLIPDFTRTVTGYLEDIRINGMLAALQNIPVHAEAV